MVPLISLAWKARRVSVVLRVIASASIVCVLSACAARNYTYALVSASDVRSVAENAAHYDRVEQDERIVISDRASIVKLVSFVNKYRGAWGGPSFWEGISEGAPLASVEFNTFSQRGNAFTVYLVATHQSFWRGGSSSRMYRQASLEERREFCTLLVVSCPKLMYQP